MTGVFREETSLKFQVDLNIDVEEAVFEQGESVEIVEDMDNNYLAKCALGHFYHIRKDLLIVEKG